MGRFVFITQFILVSIFSVVVFIVIEDRTRKTYQVLISPISTSAAAIDDTLIEEGATLSFTTIATPSSTPIATIIPEEDVPTITPVSNKVSPTKSPSPTISPTRIPTIFLVATKTPVPTLRSTPSPTIKPSSTPTPKPTNTPVPTVAFSKDPNNDAVWEALAECESHKNWSIDTGNGYYGGLQFSQGAWNSVGGSGNPAHASREEQIARGKQLQAMRGWGPWGACSRSLGL